MNNLAKLMALKTTTKQFLSLLIAVFSFFVFGVGLQSCNKHTCPTYSTSGPSKGVKKKIKKNLKILSK